MTATQPAIRPRTWFLLLLILILGAALRLANLEYAPVGGHGDVAWIGINALDWIDSGVFPYYVWELYAPEPLIVQLTGLAIPLFGVSYLSPRLVTVLFGLLLVAFLFPATWWLLDGESSERRERAALLASLAAALSVHANYLSRLGMRAALFPALAALLVWLTVRAWRRGGWRAWVLAGLALALMQYAYIPARLFPLVLALWFGHGYFVDRPRWQGRWRGWVLLAGIAFVLTLPNIITFMDTPEAFSARADVGTAETGGWIWEYDASEAGGLASLLIKKIGLELLAFGVVWQGPYNILNQPMLNPLFFIGFLVALILLIRFPRRIAIVWPVLAIPVMFSTDLISGAVVEIHALRQTGVLPFVFILSGIGLAAVWQGLETRIRPVTGRRVLAPTLLILALLPTGLTMATYLGQFIPGQYASSETGWRDEQIDVDLSRRLLEQPDKAYLVPYDEYNRANIAWMTSAVFRDRHSAIGSDGILHIPDPPETLTLIKTALPYRIRHDGRPSQWDTRLWVLLHEGQALLLPPVTLTQERALLDAIETTPPEILLDRSDTEIARLYKMDTPEALFAPRPVIDYPLDGTLRLPGAPETQPEARLLGYTLADPDLTPGQIVYVTLFWQALGPASEDFEIFLQLWNGAGDSIAGAHDFPYGGMYRTRLWRTDEIVATHHWLQLPDELPVAAYTLAAGMFRVLHNEPLAVTGTNADPSGTVVVARDLRVAAPPVIDRATPLPFTLTFADLLEVAGMTLMLGDELQTAAATWNATPGETLSIDITWEVRQAPPVDYSLFLHLTDTDDAPPLAQADVSLGTGIYPSGVWWAGDVIGDRVQMVLPDDLTPGTYTLWAGVYYTLDNARLTPLIDRIEAPDGRLRLATINITDRSS